MKEFQKSIIWEPFRWPNETIEKNKSDELFNDSNMLQEFVSAVNKPYIPTDMHFNLYVAHSNFDLSKSIFGIVNKIPGVELFKLISRYRFMIGIGKNVFFNEKSVKQRVAVAVGADLCIDKD